MKRNGSNNTCENQFPKNKNVVEMFYKVSVCERLLKATYFQNYEIVSNLYIRVCALSPRSYQLEGKINEQI